MVILYTVIVFLLFYGFFGFVGSPSVAVQSHTFCKMAVGAFGVGKDGLGLGLGSNVQQKSEHYAPQKTFQAHPHSSAWRRPTIQCHRNM